MFSYVHASQNRDLWFTLTSQQSLLVWWLFSAIPIPILKFPIFYSSSFVYSLLIHQWICFIDDDNCCGYIEQFTISGCQVQCKLCCYQMHFTALLEYLPDCSWL